MGKLEGHTKQLEAQTGQLEGDMGQLKGTDQFKANMRLKWANWRLK